MVKSRKRSAHPPIRPSVYAGIDAGGSHTEAVIIDGNGQELGRARGKPGAVRPDNIRAVTLTIARTVKAALKHAGRPSATSLVIAAAGAGRAPERAALRKAVAKHKLAKSVSVIGDGEAALENAFHGQPGIMVISGTGSIAYTRDPEGNVHRTGGLGPHLGDEGSGFALGRAALAAAGKSLDGRGPSSLMVELIHKATSTRDLAALIRWSQTATRDDVASLARAACEAALQGDPVARELVENASRELADHVTALLTRARLDPATMVAASGGLLAAGSPVRTGLVAALARSAPKVRVVEATVDAALGAAGLAKRL